MTAYKVPATGVAVHLCAIAAMILPPTASAHHSAAMYDSSRTLSVSGTLRSVQIGNPHSWFWVLVPGGQGGAELWGFEGGGPAQLKLGAGSTKDLFAIGQKVTVSCHPLRDGRPSGQLIRIQLEDGREFPSGPGAPDAPAEAAPPAPAASGPPQ